MRPGSSITETSIAPKVDRKKAAVKHHGWMMTGPAQVPWQSRAAVKACWSDVFVPTRGLTRNSTLPNAVVYPIEPPHDDPDARGLLAPPTNEPALVGRSFAWESDSTTRR